MTPPTIGETIGLPLLRAQMRLRWLGVAVFIAGAGLWALCWVGSV